MDINLTESLLDFYWLLSNRYSTNIALKPYNSNYSSIGFVKTLNQTLLNQMAEYFGIK